MDDVKILLSIKKIVEVIYIMSQPLMDWYIQCNVAGYFLLLCRKSSTTY